MPKLTLLCRASTAAWAGSWPAAHLGVDLSGKFGVDVEPIPKLMQEPLLVFCVRLDGGADGGINFERRLRCIAGWPHRLRGKIIRIRRGLALYQTYASPYYFARILDSRNQRYKIRSTKETNRVEARKVAEDYAHEITRRDAPADREFSFKTYAHRFVQKGQQLAKSGERNKNYIRTTRLFLDNDNWGLVRHFGTRDVRELTTRDWQLFVEKLTRTRSDLSSSTRNMLMATFRNVLKVAPDDGLIDSVPATPRQRQKDNPRSFFRFSPLVEPERDECQELLQGAKRLADEHAVVRGAEVTGELYDLILFCVHSFVRPTTTELYALKHNDITVEKDPKRLLVTVRNGKTGCRVANTMAEAVSAYERIKARYPEAQGEDYLILPDYPNRATASRIFQRQFNQLNAGTSTEQIERFYAKHLPL